MTEAPAEKPRRRGRTRDRSKDVAVLNATVKLLASDGLAGMSVDRVAAEAGVSKVTLYSRWRSKLELIGAALAHLQVDHVPAPTGRARTDAIAHLDAMRLQYVQVGGMAIVGNCLAEEPVSGELLATIRRSTLLPRRANLVQVLHDGVSRGELPEHVDAERLVSALMGCLYADHLADRPVDERWATDVVDTVLGPWLASPA